LVQSSYLSDAGWASSPAPNCV